MKNKYSETLRMNAKREPGFKMEEIVGTSNLCHTNSNGDTTKWIYKINEVSDVVDERKANC